LHYTASGIITPIGVMIPDKYTEMHGQQNVKIFCLITFFYKSCLFEIMLNTIQPEGPQMTI